MFLVTLLLGSVSGTKRAFVGGGSTPRSGIGDLSTGAEGAGVDHIVSAEWVHCSLLYAILRDGPFCHQLGKRL